MYDVEGWHLRRSNLSFTADSVDSPLEVTMAADKIARLEARLPASVYALLSARLN
jgi:hypothetical protein